MMGKVQQSWILSLLLCAIVPVTASACPFCVGQGETLSGEVKQASLVLFGKLGEATPDTNSSGFSAGSTQMTVEMIVKSHPEKPITPNTNLKLDRYLPLEGDKEDRALVFCDWFKGRVQPYKVVSVKANSDLPKYLKGILELKDSKVADRLRFAFTYLDNDDLEVSLDAYREFQKADYADFREMAGDLPADKVRSWLDPEAKTPGFRIGLYASMLGHCGEQKDADLLRELLEDPAKRVTSGVDGVLAAYTMLDPKEGVTYIRGILGDPKKPFLTRYAALRAVRFFWEYRTDVVSKPQVIDAVSLMLDQKDVADLAIDDLRKWKYWDAADRVLGLTEKEPYKVPIVRRAVLRYALSCQDSVEAARKYVAEQRQKDPQGVADIEELLKIEQASTSQANDSGK